MCLTYMNIWIPLWQEKLGRDTRSKITAQIYHSHCAKYVGERSPCEYKNKEPCTIQRMICIFMLTLWEWLKCFINENVRDFVISMMIICMHELKYIFLFRDVLCVISNCSICKCMLMKFVQCTFCEQCSL